MMVDVPLIPDDKLVFTVPEVAAILGVVDATVRRLAQRQELPMYKIGHAWVMNRGDLLNLLGMR